MTTRLDLLNDALDALGEPRAVTATISATTSDWIKRAERQLDRSAKLIAEGHPWNFLTSIHLLSETETAEPIGWDYEFEKPANCLRICKASNDGGWRSTPIDFEDRGGLLLSNHESTYLHHVDQAKLDLTGSWPEHFALAVALESAWRASMGTSLAQARRDSLASDLRQALSHAKSWDGQQMSAKPRYAGAFVTAARAGWRTREND